MQYYNNYKADYNILQTYLDNIDLNVLFEKYPIVIYDRLLDPRQLLKTLFVYTYTFKKEFVLNTVKPVYNGSKYMIIWSHEKDVSVNIINPKYKSKIKWIRANGITSSSVPLTELDNEIQYVTVKLKANQIMILPAFWIFDASARVNVIQLDDLLSSLTFK
jgi:hypothetical protein